MKVAVHISEKFGILSNGSLVYCHLDYDGKTAFANAHDNKLQDIFQKPPLQREIEEFPTMERSPRVADTTLSQANENYMRRRNLTEDDLTSEKLRMIEAKWQKKWSEDKVFESRAGFDRSKYYVLEMFPYPSGEMHMGHVRNYSIGYAFARFKQMQGYNVFHPMGFDSFGLPAENVAIKHGENPQEWTERNISFVKNGLKRIGFTYDWEREI